MQQVVSISRSSDLGGVTALVGWKRVGGFVGRNNVMLQHL